MTHAPVSTDPACPLLQVDGFGLAFGAQIVLTDVSLRIDRPGVHVVMGPVATGKSSLVRTLAGLNDAQPAMRTWGVVHLREPGATLVGQDARSLISSVRENLVAALPNRSALTPGQQSSLVKRMLNEAGLGHLVEDLATNVIELNALKQRQVAIARAAFARPALLCLDEPTAGLDANGKFEIVKLVRHYAGHFAALIVTHDQAVARLLGGHLTLLAGGRVQEQGPTARFFEQPRSIEGRQFVRSGSCRSVGPNVDPATLATDAPPPPPLPSIAAKAIRQARGPNGFYWLQEGRIGALPRPGIVNDVEADVRGLRDLGVRWLFTLEESRTVPAEVLSRAGIRNVLVPVVDMGVPELCEMSSLCEQLETLSARGEPVAVHCLAGLGRTGTVMACLLIFGGETASTALHRVRALRPRSVQSQLQLDFLGRFEAHVGARGLRSQGSESPVV